MWQRTVAGEKCRGAGATPSLDGYRLTAGERSGAEMGGGGGPFYGDHEQLKRPLAAEEPYGGGGVKIFY